MNTKLIPFVICGAGKTRKGRGVVETAQMKSAPHYFEKTVPQQYVVSQSDFEIDGKKGALFLKFYPPDFLLAEARFDTFGGDPPLRINPEQSRRIDFPDILSENDIIVFKEKVMSFCRGRNSSASYQRLRRFYAD